MATAQQTLQFAGDKTAGILNGGRGRWLTAYLENANSSARYLFVYNQVTVPASGDVPVMIFEIPASPGTQHGVLDLTQTRLTDGGLPFSAGIAFAISTDPVTLTAATAADHFGIITGGQL